MTALIANTISQCQPVCVMFGTYIMLRDHVVAGNVDGNLLKVSIGVVLRAVVDEVVVDLAEEVLRPGPLHDQRVLTLAGEVDDVGGAGAADVGEELQGAARFALGTGGVRLDPHLVLRVRS